MMDELAKIFLTNASLFSWGEWHRSDISLNSLPGLKEINAWKVIFVPDLRALT